MPAFGQELTWQQSFTLLKKNPDPVAEKLLVWLAVTTTPQPASIEALIDFTIKNSGWPTLHEFRERIEKGMGTALRPHGIVDWCDRNPPKTVRGLRSCMGAFLRLGHHAKAKNALQKFWLGAELDKKDTSALVSQYRKLFSPTALTDRLDGLLWDSRYQEAEYMLPLVDADRRKLGEARMALGRMSSSASKKVRAVPAALQKDAGLLFDRLKWRRQMNKDEEAFDLLRQAPKNVTRPELWWKERNILARRALEKNAYLRAYKIIHGHGLIAAADYSQAEWLLGWISLRFLHQPDKAYRHFDNFYQAVHSAVSRARGAWWLARAAEALKQPDTARNWDTLSAQFPSTFYGQLSLEKLSGPADSARFPDDQAPADVVKIFEKQELVRAVRLLAGAGMSKYADPFFIKLLEKADTRSDFVLIAKLARDIKRPYFAVEANKQIQQKLGSFMFTEGYPLLPRVQVTAPESALIHAVVHRESMFDPAAESHAGARGLMQLMPRTAKHVSKSKGKKFTVSKLTDNPQYNIELGAAYLQSLLDDYDGFYPLALAAYNAGPGNVDQWIREFGDPRRRDVDLIDWIETIPIYETRNYIQRVMESYYIYKLRLSEKPKTVLAFGR